MALNQHLPTVLMVTRGPRMDLNILEILDLAPGLLFNKSINKPVTGLHFHHL